MPNILVTGSEGFIGKYLVEELENQGYDVIGYDIENKEDILDYEQFLAYLKKYKIDVVFHLAAVADLNWSALDLINTKNTLDINIKGTQNVALACQDAKTRLIYISTCCVYGHQKEHPTTEEALPYPAEIYAFSKLAGEEIIQGINRSWGLSYNIARIATVYGYGQRPALGTWIFMDQAFNNEDITIHGEGDQERTLTHVEDIVSGLIAIMEAGEENEIYNVSTDIPVTAKEMAATIRATVGSDSRVVHIDQRANQVFKEQISYEKLANDTGWKPKYRFNKGISETIDRYREEYDG